jgi:hypothetical protein
VIERPENFGNDGREFNDHLASPRIERLAPAHLQISLNLQHP